MQIKINFHSEEAIYVQLKNQIVIGIATETIREGDMLPSVRALAEDAGINMHTVNKAYTLLKQEGFVQLDRRKGAMIALDLNKLDALADMEWELRILLAKGRCKGISKDEIHALVDEILEEYQ